MAQLIVRSESSELTYFLQKKITSVGTAPTHDIRVKSTTTAALASDARPRPEGLLFSVNRVENGYEIYPGKARLRLNGDPLQRTTRLRSCDRVEWDSGVAVFVQSAMARPEREGMPGTEDFSPLAILHNLASTLHAPEGGPQAALQQALNELVRISAAEEGYLLAESGEDGAWKLLASGLSPEQSIARSRSELFSDTILAETLRTRAPVYVENIIGHPYAEAASVIDARIFSVACFPLLVGQRVLGAVFLFTRSPGKSIRKEQLPELGILATQAALLMSSAQETAQLRRENRFLRRDASGEAPRETSGRLVYDRADAASALAEVERKIVKLAPTPLSVLIQGETGTGKEIAAREIHERGTRASKPFVAINCAAIPATLLEATLFGYERGAFTGAVKAQAGKFALADGGTLFLDEIGDLPLDLQSKLLRVLQEKAVEPIGAPKPVRIDVRIVAATHRDLPALVQKGAFRQDLYFRLAGATLSLPPLRSRPRDIEVLARHFLALSASGATLSAEAIALLRAHPWPGNVRELEQVVTRAALLAEGPEIFPGDVELQSLGMPPGENASFWGEYEDLDQAQRAFTQRYVRTWLDKFQGSRTETARRLGVSERTLYRILSEADRPGSLP